MFIKKKLILLIQIKYLIFKGIIITLDKDYNFFKNIKSLKKQY